MFKNEIVDLVFLINTASEVSLFNLQFKFWKNLFIFAPSKDIIFFHIPIIEYSNCKQHTPFREDMIGSKNEDVGSSYLNSGLFSEIISHKRVKMINVGHDHVNDFCKKCFNVTLCYGGGVGYNTYGKKGFQRRLRLIEISNSGNIIKTWKRLYDLTKIDYQEIN